MITFGLGKRNEATILYEKQRRGQNIRVFYIHNKNFFYHDEMKNVLFFIVQSIY